jgi:hypothetical protein
LEAFEFDGFRIGSIGSSMRRIVGGDLTRFEINEIKSFVRRRAVAPYFDLAPRPLLPAALAVEDMRELRRIAVDIRRPR